MKAFLWSVVKNALPLRVNLQKRGLISATPCLRCQNLESDIYMFFTCPFAVKVWKCDPLRQEVHIAADSSFKEAIIKFRTAVCLPPSGFALNTLPWICWAIWTARNSLIFEGKTFSPEEIALKGLRLAKEWPEAQGKTSEIKLLPSALRSSSNRSSRSTDTSRLITCKTDAA